MYGLVSIAVYPPTALTPSTQPIVASPKNVIDHARRSGSTNIVVPPALLQQIAQESEMVEFMLTLDFVVSLFLIPKEVQ